MNDPALRKTMKTPENEAQSRRKFLKGIAIAGVMTATPSLSRAAGEESAPKEGREELATLLDLSKCIGCGACVQACRETNAGHFPRDVRKPLPVMYPTSRTKPEDWSDKQDVDDRLTPYNWLFIQSAGVDYKGEHYDINIPRRCMHCRNPPCADLCPWGAAYRQKNGIVRINHDICLGGAKCRKVCPWHIPQRQSGVGLYLDLLPQYAGNGVMYKCTRCHERVAEGLTPACIEACPMDVQKIGPRGAILEEARALATEMGGFIYGEHENGGTNTFYVSPVPFGLLNKNIEKGPGRPHLHKVEDHMAKAENLTWAVAMGPLAGIGAGLLTVVKAMKKDKGETNEIQGGE